MVNQMDQKNRNNKPDNDATGEIISWVVIFILMFAFWPVGLPMLIVKLRGYAKPAGNAARRANAQASQAASQASTRASASGQWYENNAARQAYTHAYTPDQRSNYNQHKSYTQPGNAAKDIGDAAKDIGDAARKAAHEFEIAARQAASQYTGQAKQAISEIYTDITRDFSQPQKKEYKEYKKNKNQKRLEKKSGKFVSTILLLIAIALFIIGANNIARAAQDIWVRDLNSWFDLWMGVFCFIGGFISFFSRNIGVRRFGRYKKYYNAVAGRGIVPISDIVRIDGRSARVVTRDIQSMINDGYFGPDAYIDSELDSLVLVADAATQARRAKYSVEEQPPPVTESPENQYMSIILELRALNDTIVDIAISDKIDRIEMLTAKIFRIVEDNPAKLPQIRRFMNYYLPTTLKLLHSYALLEKQGIKGENITSAKENISRILDTLATGYEQQLDQLFSSDVIDIAADINVLENLMQQDGLTEEKPVMQTMEST